MNSNNHAPSRLFRVAALVFLLPAVVFGQGSNGVINGTVSDATGAVIPGARVTIANAETGVANTVESGINGAYTLPLPAGPVQHYRRVRRLQAGHRQRAALERGFGSFV